MRTSLFSLHTFVLCLAALFCSMGVWAQSLTIICTTDVHGNYFPYDFVRNTDGKGSLARVYYYVKEQRKLNGEDNVLLLDAGDILQGQPSAYYYNFVDTTSVHICAQVMNFMKYDAAVVGNHDIETGHNVYDRWAAACNFPVLAANVVGRDGKPYWKPYVVVKKAGLRIAVFGLITPTVPRWLPERLWSGMEFRDMVQTAREYMPQMKREADVVVGVFHSGVGVVPEGGDEANMLENASLAVARRVPGFDVVFCGHDHRRADTKVVNIAGANVPVLNAGSGAEYVATAMRLYRTPDGKNIIVTRDFPFSEPKTTYVKADTTMHGSLVNISNREADKDFMRHFRKQIKTLKKYTQEVIGQNDATLSTRDAYFGPSNFIDYIHALQLQVSGADISFAAPLGFDSSVPAGTVRVGQMFSLYPYENMLCVMRLTGREVKEYLEYSYAGWTRRVNPASSDLNNQRLLLFRNLHPRSNPNPKDNWNLLATPSYNYDSAGGLRYVVDVSKPAGDRVVILGMADGTPFDMEREYRVALNSYRACGGGGHLTDGAHISKDELQRRIVWSTDRDLRHYLTEAIRRDGGIHAKSPKLWHFEPADVLQPLIDNDRRLLFPEE